MKIRKSKEISKILLKKGFKLDNTHHQYYYFYDADDKRTPVYTYISHGIDEYGNDLMTKLKKQLKFQQTKDCEDFLDCPLTKEDYLKLLKNNGEL